VVQDIGERLREPSPDWFPLEKLRQAKGHSPQRGHQADLASGLAGIALLHTYMHQAWRRAGDAESALDLLNEALEIAGQQRMLPDLFGGYAGVAWAATHIHDRLAPAEEDPVSSVDDLLVEILSQKPWRGSYDLVMGLVGIGVHALERHPRPAASTCLELVISHLEAAAEHRPGGLTWLTPPAQLTAEERLQAPNGYYNLGVAHGVPGVIGLLGAAYAAGVAKGRALSLVEGAVSWLLMQKPLQRYEDVLPYWITSENKQGKKARLGWCYGAPGIAASLLYAARCVGRENWEQEATRLALAAAKVPLQKSRIVDAGLCHGSAGLAHLLNRMYQATGEERLAAAARFWFEHTLSLRRHGEGITGFLTCLPAVNADDPYVPDSSLLMGAAGIGLALLASITNVEPEWDRILLVASPPESNPGMRG
jgi:lantibiotic modifying enzyme